MAALIEFSDLVVGTIQRRYQRFLADVLLEDGSLVTAHCTNTGTMKTCWEPGDAVLLRHHDDPKRKLAYTWIACQRGSAWVGVDTGVPNKVVAEAARRDAVPGLTGLREVRTEVPYGHERSRIDVWAQDAGGREVFIEVKNTTLKDGAVGRFPDAVTTRGAKHLRELEAMVAVGHRAAIAFFVHRSDVETFAAAREVDPAYAAALDRAATAGVLVLPLKVRLEWDASSRRLAWSLDGLLPWATAG